MWEYAYVYTTCECNDDDSWVHINVWTLMFCSNSKVYMSVGERKSNMIWTKILLVYLWLGKFKQASGVWLFVWVGSYIHCSFQSRHTIGPPKKRKKNELLWYPLNLIIIKKNPIGILHLILPSFLSLKAKKRMSDAKPQGIGVLSFRPSNSNHWQNYCGITSYSKMWPI